MISCTLNAELNILSCFNDLLNGRSGSSIAPSSGTTLLLIFQGEDSPRQEVHGLAEITAEAAVVPDYVYWNPSYLQLLPHDACPSRSSPMANEVSITNQTSLSSYNETQLFCPGSLRWVRLLGLSNCSPCLLLIFLNHLVNKRNKIHPPRFMINTRKITKKSSSMDLDNDEGEVGSWIHLRL